MTAKARLLAAARAGGSSAVRTLLEDGNREVVVVRCDWSRDLLQYTLTDHNYHRVEIIGAANGLVTLSAPAEYDLERIMREIFRFKIVK